MEGIDVAKVTAWFDANIDGVRPPLRFELIPGGRSNLTYSVTDAAGTSWVLRRPPLGHVLPTAHDMRREHRIISALGPTPVPVPRALGYCGDPVPPALTGRSGPVPPALTGRSGPVPPALTGRSGPVPPALTGRSGPGVNGAPFFVMEFVDGLVVRDVETAKSLEPEARTAAGASLVEVLVAIHSLDPDAIGLGDLGRKDRYIERQLKRWYGQFQQSKLREVPAVDEMHDFLVAHIPEQQAATLVHGDYRLDNCLLDTDGRVKAVLD
ncbi:MAG: phosphotransferase family protein, partial [Actinobacteria bacterium]|nr:phosphotransferase family protein [Actinomycetota bacterium]